MGFNADMRAYTLLKKVAERTPSGAVRETWIPSDSILVAVYKLNEYTQNASQKYLEASHRGVTYSLGLLAGQKLQQGDRELEVLQVIEARHKAVLTLKELSDG